MMRGFVVLLALLVVITPVIAQDDQPPLLTYGTRLNGRLDATRIQDSYQFDGLRGEVVAIDVTVTSGDLDPMLIVLDSDGVIVGQADDTAGNTAPALRALRLPRADRYQLVVARFGYGLGVTSGAYELGLNRVGVSSSSGSMLRYGDQVINSISNMQPQLYYSFQASQGDIINVHMRRVSGDLDSYLQIVDRNAFVLADNDDSLGAATPFDSSIRGLVIEEDGNYIIVASRYGQAAGTSSGNFVLMLEEGDNSTLGSTPDAAFPLSFGSVVQGEITADQPVRYYRFHAETDDLVTIRMNRVSGNLDAAISLTNTGLIELVNDDDSGGGQNALIQQYRIPAAGVHYIVASRLDGVAGTTAGLYQLELAREGNAFAGLSEDVGRISYGTTVTGRIDDMTPEVLYAFWGTEGDTITVSMNRADGNLDPVVSILNTEAQSVVSNDDGGDGQNARITEYTIPVTGTYFVRATRYSGEDGMANTQGSFVLVLARRFN